MDFQITLHQQSQSIQTLMVFGLSEHINLKINNGLKEKLLNLEYQMLKEVTTGFFIQVNQYKMMLFYLVIFH